MMIKKKVLVIEDNNLIRLEIKHILEKKGVEVIELPKAEPIFEAPWRYHDIDLLLLDIILPGMDGLTALEMMRKDETWACLPTILLSAKSDMASVHRAIKAGAINYIRKPFSREELWMRVEQALSLTTGADLSNTKLDALMASEVNRAKRSKTSVSFVEIVCPQEEKTITGRQGNILRDKIKSTLRDIDSIVTTSQGNFMLLLPLTRPEGVNVVMEKVRKHFEGISGNPLKFAIATYPNDGESVDSLLQVIESKLK